MAGRNVSDNDIPIWVLDTVTNPQPEHACSVILAGSHGGIYAGYLAASAGPRGIILNDAGIGRDNAGIGSLTYLEDLGIAAATISHESGRIGDAEDMLAHGIVSHTNANARDLGCFTGQLTIECAKMMRQGKPFTGKAPAKSEGRYKLQTVQNKLDVWGLDSASLLIPEDAGKVVIIGSHGAILASNKTSGRAIYQPVLAAVFHDAGIGRDSAGLSRLPVMDKQGVPGATISHQSARIGDSRSMWSTGKISHVNELASSWGAQCGISCQEFAVATIVRRSAKKVLI